MISVLPSHLDDNQLSAIQNLEKELGTSLYAYNTVDVSPAGLSETELDKVKELEDQLHIHLLAISQ
jgi:hypothetical protein